MLTNKNILNKTTLELRTLKSTIFGGILFILTFIQSFLLVPIFLKFWGNEKYGIWLSIIAIVSILKTIDIGHQNFIGNEFNKFIYKDIIYSKKLLSSSFIFSFIIGFFELFLFLFLFYYLNPDKYFGIPNNLKEGDYRFGLFIYVLITTIFSGFVGILVKASLAFGFYSSQILINIFIKLFEIIILTITVFYNFNLNYSFISLAFITLTYTFITIYFVKTSLPELYPWWVNSNFKMGLINYLKSIQFTFNSFIDQFNTSGIFILVSKSLGILSLPVITTLKTFTNITIQITSLFTNPIIPDLIRYDSTSEIKKINNIIETNWFIVGLIVTIPLLIITPFVEHFYNFWVQKKLIFNFSLYCYLSLSVLFVNLGRMNFNYFYGINSINSMFLITCTRFILTFTLSILLIPYYGIISIGISLFIAEFFSSLLLPIFLYSYHTHNKNFKIFSIVYKIGIIQIIILIVVYLIFYFRFNNFYYYYVLMILFLFYTSYLQWVKLNFEIKNRIKILLYKLFKFHK